MDVFMDGLTTAATLEARMVDKKGQFVGQPMTATLQAGDSVALVGA